MYRKIALIGGTAAAVLGVGTAALATTGSDTPSSTSSSPASSSASTDASQLARFAKRHPLLAGALKHHVVHGQIVTKGKNGYVTHDGILGTVTAVSASSITVKASDGFTETFSVSSSTAVRVRTAGKGAKGTISDVHNGDQVGVAGTGTSTPTATVIVDVHKS